MPVTAPGFLPVGGMQVDGLVSVRLRRITNGGVDNPNGVFLMLSDMHYQSTAGLTKNRNYPFN